MPSSSVFSVTPEVHCYEIEGKIFFYPKTMTLVNFCGEQVVRTQLRTTMGNLLKFLLESGEKGIISEDEILTEVWEKNCLRASAHRLWQVSRDLNYKLTSVGLTLPLYEKINRKRLYTVNMKIVVPLYVKKVPYVPAVLNENKTISKSLEIQNRLLG